MPSPERRPVTPWALAALSAGVAAFGFATAMRHLSWAAFLDDASPGGLLGGVAIAALAATILTSRPRHPVGWSLMATALAGAVGATADVWARAGLPGSHAAAVLTNGLPTSYALVALSVALFPDGAASRLQRALAALAALAAVLAGPVAVCASLSVPTAELLDSERLPPHASWLLYASIAAQPIATLVLVAMTATLWRMVLRAGPPARQQAGWFLYGVAFVVAFTAASLTAPHGQVLAALARVAFVAAMTVAITRHRLFDLDLAVSRTVAWLLLTGLLLALYGGIVVSVGAAGGTNSARVALATLAAALVFQPARRRLQSAVDRRLRPGTVSAVAVVDAFVALLRAGQAQATQIEEVIATALEQPRVRVAFEFENRWLDVHGRPFVAPEHATTVPVGGLPGAGAVVALTAPVPPARVDAVLRAALLPLELARLELNVRTSRARMVEAVDGERQRIERDLHDGAQQRLVGLGLALRLLAEDIPTAAPGLGRAVDQLEAAIAELRGLAGGIFPQALVEDGLSSAVADLADRSPVPVTATVAGPRPEQAVELTGWFVVLEAVTNAIKHADASAITVAVRHGATTTVEVADDGRGGADERGIGLRGLRDRVEVAGGVLRVTSPAGGGTTVWAELPCAR